MMPSTTMSASSARAVATLVRTAFAARSRGDGVPFILAHFVTNRCNCKCASCLWRHNDWQDVPLEDLKRLYRDAHEAGFAAAAFSGGEPLLRKDLGELAAFVGGELGMPILLFTTGWYVKRRMHEVLPHVAMLSLSIDSALRERHDEIRGLPGLYDRLMESLDLVAEHYPDLPVQLNCCVQQGITDEIDALVGLARDKGVRISFDVITERRNGSDGSAFTETAMSLPPAELRQVCERLVAHKQAGAPIVNSERYFRYFAEGRPGYACHFPKLAMSVDGRGYVEDCLDLDTPIANIRDSSLAEIMALPRFRQLRADAERCSSCSSPTMVDLSHVWEDPSIALRPGGIAVA